MPKVKFGFKNAYYSKIIVGTSGTISYATPVKLKGAVSITLAPAGNEVEFYAEDGLYFSDSANNGYDGDLELAMIQEDFLKDILGEVEDRNNVLQESVTASTSPFALLCEFTTDDGAKKFAFYNCTASRPELSSKTKGESKEIQTEKLSIKIRPNADGLVKTSTKSDTTALVISEWYSSVYIPTNSSNSDTPEV